MQGLGYRKGVLDKWRKPVADQLSGSGILPWFDELLLSHKAARRLTTVTLYFTTNVDIRTLGNLSFRVLGARRSTGVLRTLAVDIEVMYQKRAVLGELDPGNMIA